MIFTTQIRGEEATVQAIAHSGFTRTAELSKLDQFAELLAEGALPADASLRVYGTSIKGNAMLQRIRKRLGPQAI